MSNSFIMTESIVRPAKMPYGRLKDNGFVGIEGEHAARALVVETKDDLSAFASINLIIDDLDCGAMTKTTIGSTTMLSMTLTSSMIGRSGRKICQLIMVNSGNTVVQKSSQFEAYVGRANEIERSVDDGVTIIILSEAVTEMAREAATAAAQEAVADVVEDCQAIADDASASADAAAQSASDAQTAAASIVVDSALDATSTHALQNKVVTSEINALKADLDDVEDIIGGGGTTQVIPQGSYKEGYYGVYAPTMELRYAESTLYYSFEPVDISNFKVGTEITIMASLVTQFGAFIIDENYHVLAYVDGNTAVEKGYEVGSRPQLITLTIPNGAKYIVSDIRSAYFNGMSDFTITGTVNDEITIIKNDISVIQNDISSIRTDGNVFSGKKWVACGDSFTAGSFTNSLTNDYTFTEGLYSGEYKVYPFWIGRRNADLTVINEAISGSTMGAGENGVNAFSDVRYTQIPSDADYITMAFGINDSGNSVPLGTIDDTTNETFYGAWNVVLEYLITNYPFAHIGIIVGPGMQTTKGQTYAEAEIAIAKKWGIPYLNIQFESGGPDIPLMLRTSNPNVSSDVKTLRNNQQYVNPNEGSLNMHPNEKAHEFESTFIEAFLRRI